MQEATQGVHGTGQTRRGLSIQPSPILIKEMRSTMRGSRTFAGITFFLLFLTGMTLMVFYTISGQSYGTGAATAGRTIFGFVTVVESLMLAVITLPLTAGAIASERQNQTFEMLMATPLTAAQVLRGKLAASMNYLFLLMLAGLPVNAIVFLFGGVTPQAFIAWIVLAATVLLMLGTLGLLMSTLVRRSGIATSLCYLVCVLLFGILPMVGLMGLAFAVPGGQPTEIVVRMALTVALLHPGASLLAILVDESTFNAAMILPATIPLYAALAGMMFFGAEARLSVLSARRWNRWLPMLFCMVVIVGAILYIVLVPAAGLTDTLAP